MPRSLKLTAKKIKVYQYIVDFKSKHDGCSPSIRQIGRDLGITSTSAVSYNLDKLAEMGVIKITQLGESRMIGVKGGTWTPPESVDWPEEPQTEIKTIKALAEKKPKVRKTKSAKPEKFVISRKPIRQSWTLPSPSPEQISRAEKIGKQMQETS